MVATIVGGQDDGDWKAVYQPVIARQTGPLESLHGRKVLLVADIENLFYSAQEWKLGIEFERLGQLLESAADSIELHAFFSCRPGDRRCHRRFQKAGWVPHPNEIEVVHTNGNARRRANSDNVLLFWAGYLSSRPEFEVVVIGTGDGDLGCDLAREVVRGNKARSVVTLSIAGCTSGRLHARKNPYIDANLEVGLDCLEPLKQTAKRGWFPMR